MKEHTIRSIYFKDQEKRKALIMACVYLCISLLSFIGLDFIDSEWGVFLIMACFVLPPLGMYFFYGYWFARFDKISLTEEGILREAKGKTSFIKYEDITSIEHRSWLEEIIVRSKKTSMHIPKHNTLFAPFYETLEEKVFEQWREKLKDGSIAFKETFTRRTLRFLLVIASIVLLFGVYPSPLEHYDSSIYMIYGIIALCLVTWVTSLLNSYRFHAQHFSFTSLLKIRNLPITKVRYMRIQSDLTYKDIVLERWDKKEFRMSNYNFPIPMIFRFLQSHYGIKQAIEL